MSDLFGNHIVGFPTRRLIFLAAKLRDKLGGIISALKLVKIGKT